MRNDLAQLCAGLNGTQSPPVRIAITAAILNLFDTATAMPEPAATSAISDTNGSSPLLVDQMLLNEETAAHIPNGFDPEGK
jgi:hypothetical protein